MDDETGRLAEAERLHREMDERVSDPLRVLALSDGVFAIVLTLLVLGLQAPDLGQGQTLGQALAQIRPSFIAFLISFVVVAIAWVGHRSLFALVRRTDRTLVWLNLLYLLPLSMLPFGASLIARYDTDPVALAIYGMLLEAIALTRALMWWYATSRPSLLSAPIDDRLRRKIVAIVILRALAYLMAIVIARSAPLVSLAIYGLVPVIYLVTSLFRRESGATEASFA